MRLQIIATFASTYMMSFEAAAKPQGLFFPTDDGKDSGINFAIPPDLNKNETIGFDEDALKTTTESHSNVLFQQEEKGDVDFVDNFQAFALRTFISQYGITEPLFEKCSSDGKSVPYFDSAKAKIDCFEILSQGPCQGNQWLVLNDFGEAVCQDKTCADGVEHQGKCVRVGDRGPCQQNEEILPDLHGQGQCECSDGSWRGRRPFVSDEDQTCYRLGLGEKGPCQEEGDFWVLRYGPSGTTQPVCTKPVCDDGYAPVKDPDDCQELETEENNVCPHGMWLQSDMFGKGKCGCKPGFYKYEGSNEDICYQEGLPGPCTEPGQRFSVNEDTGLTFCENTFCANTAIDNKKTLVPFTDVTSGTAEASGDCYEVDPDIVKDCPYEMIFNKEKLSVDCQTAIDSLRTLFNMEKARRIKRIDQNKNKRFAGTNDCLVCTWRKLKQLKNGSRFGSLS